MTFSGPGNPDPPETNGRWKGEACPICGKRIKLLPEHLPECPEA